MTTQPRYSQDAGTASFSTPNASRDQVLDFYAQQKPPLNARNIAPLEQVLAYENAPVLRRFTAIYDIPWDEADELFTETKRFMWACAMSPHSMAPTTIIDKMWHNFLLFTPDYADFCSRNFGYFVHHLPADREFEQAKDPQGFKKRAQTQFSQQIATLKDLVGTQTVIEWYLEHPLRYDDEFFKTKTIAATNKTINIDSIKAFLAS